MWFQGLETETEREQVSTWAPSQLGYPGAGSKQNI